MSTTLNHSFYNDYKDKITALPSLGRLEPKHLLNVRFRIKRSDGIEIYYVPTDYINRKAEVVLVGITPGWHQMEIAFRIAGEKILKGLGRVAVCRDAKNTAAFSGSMRKNLLDMLDGIDIPKAMRISSSDELFKQARRRVHTTSVLRYPVFVEGNNYTGHRPQLLNHPLLKRYVDEDFCAEMEMIPNAFIIPMGDAVSAALEYLVTHGAISGDRCCFGFPHPSGANAHRKDQFKAQRQAMRKKVRRWFGG
jgi:hypothetical protein